MRIVTGGAGFIGNHIVRKLLSLGHKVKVIDNLSKGELNNLKDCIDNPNLEFIQADLLDISKAKELLKDADTIYHLAARIGGIGYFHKIPATLLVDNNILTQNIFEAAKENKTKVVYLSSSMVFERATEFPSTEESLNRIPPPITAYGYSKLAGEYIARAYNDEFGVPYVIVRPFNAYGPGEAPGDYYGYSHVIPDLVKKLSLGQNPLELFGNGEQVRCYTYVEDLAGGIVLAGENAVNDDFNISSDRPVSVKELSLMIWKVLGKNEDLGFKYIETFKDDVQKRVSSSLKIRTKLGWQPKMKFEEGLRITVNWLGNRLKNT